MDTKVYLRGVNVVVERAGIVPHYIPTRSARMQPHNGYVQITDNETGWSLAIDDSDLQNAEGIGFGTSDEGLDYLSGFVGSFNTDGLSGQTPSEASFSKTAQNYTALASEDGSVIGELAYAFESEGTKWLPLTLGGTYRPQGVYVWDSTDWVSDRTAIAQQLQLNLDAIEGKVDKVFMGWVQYSDTQYTQASPLTISGNVRTRLTNDAGLIIDLVNMFGADTIWNPTTNKFVPDNSGDKYTKRVSFTADPALNNRNLTLELDIGGNQGVIWSRTIRLSRGAGIDTKVTENLDFYTLNTFVANGGDLFIECDGDIDLYDIIFLIERTFRNG